MVEQEKHFLNNFRLGTREEPIWISHYINPNNDSTYFEVADKVVMTIDRSAYAYNAENRKFGMFRTDSTELWRFCFEDSNQFIPTPNKDLIKAEVLVFKQLVERGVIKLK